ncbi:protein CEBPZOS-like [Stegodyphus dumicola]|uniref:protein CEBPZOS-like n=1 Tax=Stegodyphus dumicola TaxID=202533 RepID=UPI0015B14671|nr:protein CEBPZOS-like [Stegodyphus dumicola]XP_035223590.1 protein CEBPZOS-like [Stegodyphus dumicola]XP_035223591.1 protein CEBPZOS-like [Stegodyphus dumicola]XP_035223592.1 protein CEBPZOS-like [Stegodyphus dumicola]
MYRKLWKTAKWAVIGGAAADIICLAGGYYFYHQMKNSRDFRYKIYNYDPRFVDVYYRANEKFGDGTERKNDYSEWGIKEIKSFENLHWFGL